MLDQTRHIIRPYDHAQQLSVVADHSLAHVQILNLASRDMLQPPYNEIQPLKMVTGANERNGSKWYEQILSIRTVHRLVAL